MAHRTNHDTRLRVREEGEARVSFMELFFDLVFVFAVTQLSHLLLEHLSVHGALQTLLLLQAVWWAWVYTAWFTNWFDPDHRGVRLLLVGVMLASLIMSATLPDAFGDRGMVFAVAYVAMQVGRNTFAVVASREQDVLHWNFRRILCWSLLAGVFWIAGGIAEDSTREVLWLGAVAVDYAAPVCGFFTPRWGRSSTRDWTIVPTHLAERCQLFLIVALGESILVTGATFGDLDFTTTVVAAMMIAFLGSVALWWTYFDLGVDAAGEVLSRAADPGRIGRSAYTYFHLPMVAGVIVTAVGDELLITHPTGHASTALVATVVGGPALFLAGHFLFKLVTFSHVSMPRLTALAFLAVVAAAGSNVSPLLIAGAVTLVVTGVVVWDRRLFARGAHTPAPVSADEFAPAGRR